MKTTACFENAIHKLYKAFYTNILDTMDSWKHLTDRHGSGKLNYVGQVNQNFGKRFAGYTPLELLQVEIVFLKACGYQLPLKPGSNRPDNPTDKGLLFEGFSAVIAFLCSIHSIENVMDYQAVFEHRVVAEKDIAYQSGPQFNVEV